MKRKLDIACGLLPHPKILFLDEPTLGLDVQSRLNIWEHIRQLKQQGITIVITTNYLDEADQLCDRIAIIDRGEVRAIGSPKDLKASLGGDGVWLTLSDATPEALESTNHSPSGLALRSSYPSKGTWLGYPCGWSRKSPACHHGNHQYCPGLSIRWH